MKARARRPPADHRPADHRPRRRAHPPRTASAAGSSSTPWPARAPPRPPTAPASATARALRRLARRHRIPGRRDRRHRHRAARTDRPRRPDDARHQGAAPSTTATPLAGAGDNPGRIRTEASFAALCGAAPIPAGPREDQPPPTQPRRRPTGQPGAAPQRPARPATRAPRPTPPASPPRARTAKRYCAASNAPSPAKHGTCRPTPNPHPAPTTCADCATNEDSPPAQAAHHLNTHPARISELERGTRPDTTLTAAYRQWLNTQQPQTHTA